VFHLVIIAAGSNIPSRGPYQIAHHLRMHGYKVKVIQYIEHYTDEQYDELIGRFISDKTILGVSTTFMINDHMHTRVRRFVEMTKERRPSAKVMLGGVNEVVNYLIPHDINLMGVYPEDQVIDVMNQQFGKIKKLPFQIDDLRFKYGEDDNFPQGSVLPVELSRHCVFNCKFCHYHNRGMKMNDRNYDYVLEEMIDSHERFGTTKFNVLCSTFNDRESKLEEIFKRMDTLPFDAKLGGFIRIELLLKQRGLWEQYNKHFSRMIFGIETFNHEAGKAVGKGMHPDKVKQGLHEIRQAMPNMFLSSGFIVGLPGDGMVDYMDVINFVQTSKTVDTAYFAALYVNPKDGNRSSSEFDMNIEKYGYRTWTNPDNPMLLNWEREDGFTFDQALTIANQLSPMITGGYSAFGTMFMWQFYTNEEMRELGANKQFRAAHDQKVREYADAYYKLL